MDEPESAEAQEDLLDLDAIMRAFGIEAWSNLGPVTTPQSELLSLLVEIEGRRYILKERPEGLIDGDSDHRYRFQRFLQLAGIPLPPVWLTPQGEPVVTIGEDSFELQAWAEGELFTSAQPSSLAWVAAAGTMLGQLHQASRRYPGVEYRWPSEVQPGGLVQGWLNLARARAEESEIHALAAALSTWVEQWEAVLPAAMMSIGAVRGLPEFHIHGDYYALNLRFGTEGVSAVLGLHASRWEKRLLELAYGLFSFSALEWRPDDPLTRPLVKRGFDPERARLFLEAYGAIYPPVPHEAEALVDALTLIAPIAIINGPLEDIFFAREELEGEIIDDVMERLAWATSLPTWLQRVRRSLAEMWG